MSDRRFTAVAILAAILVIVGVAGEATELGLQLRDREPARGRDGVRRLGPGLWGRSPGRPRPPPRIVLTFLVAPAGLPFIGQEMGKWIWGP